MDWTARYNQFSVKIGRGKPLINAPSQTCIITYLFVSK